MKRIKSKSLMIIVVCFITTIVGFTTMYCPNPSDKGSGYSIENVKADLKELTKVPHSSLHHPKNLEMTRSHILSELNEMGIDAKVFSYPDSKTKRGDRVEINNIYGVIEGKNKKDGSHILLMAHYDSGEPIPINKNGYSFGAGDDGYGVATLLETLRTIQKNDKDLENGIKFLLTDGEEIGLLGSEQAFTKNPEIFKDVAYVINMEARGMSGPVMLVETSGNDSRVLDLYREGRYPTATSLVTDLYEGSGRSDFLHARQLGLPGINYAVTDQVEFYHTAEDSYANISEQSLMHYRDRVLPLVQKFIHTKEYADVDYFKNGHDVIFFTLVQGVLVTYPVIFGQVVSALAILMVIVLSYSYRKEATLILKNVGIGIVQITAIGAIGFAISYVAASFSGVTFDLGYMCKVPGDDFLLVMLPLVLAVFVVIHEKKTKMDFRKSLLSGMIIYSVLLSVTVFILPGGSYLFMIPLLLSLFSMGLDTVAKGKVGKYLMLLTVISCLLLFIPLASIFNMAFSIGALGMDFALVMIAKVIVLPIVRHLWVC